MISTRWLPLFIACRLLLAGLLVGLAGCSLAPELFPYDACNEAIVGGRQLHDLGTVTGTHDRNGQQVWEFKRLDGSYTELSQRPNRMCKLVAGINGLTAAQGGLVDASRPR